MVWARSGVLGIVVLATGAISHVAAGGRLPSPALMVVLLIGCLLVSALFLRARSSTLQLLALVVGGQAAVHALLSALAGHAGDPARTSSPGRSTAAWLSDLESARPRSGSLHQQVDLAHTLSGGGAGPAGGSDWFSAQISHQIDHLIEQGPLMFAAHTVGAVAVALWLAVGEAALWNLVALRRAPSYALLVRLCILRSSLAALLARQVVPAPQERSRPSTDHLVHLASAARRGPPGRPSRASLDLCV